MLDEIFSRDKRLALANARLRQAHPGYLSIHELIDGYLQDYALFNSLSPEKILDLYNHFTKTYSKHLETFKETQQYPYEYEKNIVVDKTTYDIALILSCVTDTPRLKIIESLQTFIANISSGRICVIGAGAGIELEMLRRSGKNISVIAYDFNFNNFLKKHFCDFDLRQEDFTSAVDPHSVDTVFAIEIMEHIEDYETLLKKTNKAMSAKAKLVCTTAANMPQFDHIHNMTNTDGFITTLGKCGFHIINQQRFSQRHIFSGIDSWNEWFIVEKKL